MIVSGRFFWAVKNILFVLLFLRDVEIGLQNTRQLTWKISKQIILKCFVIFWSNKLAMDNYFIFAGWVQKVCLLIELSCREVVSQQSLGQNFPWFRIKWMKIFVFTVYIKAVNLIVFFMCEWGELFGNFTWKHEPFIELRDLCFVYTILNIKML